jgi:L-lactate dehydrogenase complex protein LldG
MSARERILGRVGEALGRAKPLSAQEREAIEAKVREHPRGPLPEMTWEPLAQFRSRCLGLSSTVDDVQTLQDVPAAVARYLSANSLGSSGVCWPELAALNWADAGLTIAARPAAGNDLVGITGAYCAIAETGTLMLLSGPATHAVTSLLPETHIALVPASRIVRCMEDAWDWLRKERGTLPRQVALVSGPSRTADIELTMVLGVHGPYRVHIIILADRQDPPPSSL